MLDLKQNDRINIELQYITLNERIMNNVSYEAICFTQLSAKDISNPFLVLQEIFGEDVSAEGLQDECWELFTIAFRPNYWMKYESPLVLYKIYKKIVRLLEAGWLIYNIRPSYMMKGETTETFPNENNIVNASMFNNLHDLNIAYKMLIRLYNDNMLIFYRVDLFEILLEGLNAKCKEGESHVDEVVFDRFKEINALIQILYTIVVDGKDNELTKEDRVLLNGFKDDFLNRGGCPIYDGDLSNIFGHSIKKADLKGVLKASENVLYHNNYWGWNSNPGKVIYYFHQYLYTLEIFWLYWDKVNADSGILDFVWDIPATEAKELKGVSKDDITKPWEYINDKFTTVPLASWRNSLKEWEEAVLSNKEFKFSISTDFKSLQMFLETLIELADLRDCFPQLENMD